MQLALPIGLPEGFSYRPELVTPVEEAELARELARVTLGEVRMHGVVARRRTAHFGWDYAYSAAQVSPGPAVPPFLARLREKAAALTPLPPEAFEEVLVTEYPPGAGIGWHRDAPPFGEVIVGVSLLGPCRFRMRRGNGGRAEVVVELAPRSAYVLSGPARRHWQHQIPPVASLRYSVTFRTLRPSARRRPPS